MYGFIREFCDNNEFSFNEVERFLKKTDYGNKVTDGDYKEFPPLFFDFLEDVKKLRNEVAPKVGEDVSFSIGSDRYYEGTIVKISKSGIIYTSQGNRYRRKTGTFNHYYRIGNDCYVLFKGVHNYLDPNF